MANHIPVDKAPCPEDSGGGHFTIAEIVKKSVMFLVTEFLNGRSTTARAVHRNIADFAVYKTANAIGDALGFGHKNHDDALGLHSIGSPRKFRPVTENAALAWNRCDDEQQQELAEIFGVTVDELVEKICQMPKA